MEFDNRSGLYRLDQIHRVRGDGLDSRRLHLILLAHEQCNFRCQYCYEEFTRGEMRRDIFDRVYKLIQRRAPQLHLLEIGWFGGEPLLAAKRILAFAHRIKDLSISDSFTFVSNMSTNGYTLSSSLAAKLVNANINQFQVTLDGPAHSHNSTRKTRNGKGTYSHIWKNLEGIRDSGLDLQIIVRIHVSPDNCGHLDRLSDDLERSFGSDPRFIFHYAPLRNYGLAASRTVKHFDAHSEASILARLRSKHRDTRNTYGAAGQVSVCYAANANSFAVRSDGALLKCTVRLDDPANLIGHIDEEGRLVLDQHKLRPWVRGLVSLDARELACPSRGI